MSGLKGSISSTDTAVNFLDKLAVMKKMGQRFLFLHALCTITEGKYDFHIESSQVAKFCNIDIDSILQIIEYLDKERLITSTNSGTLVSITHLGVQQVEEALLEMDKKTTHFPPIINLNFVMNMKNSKIEQGSITNQK